MTAKTVDEYAAAFPGWQAETIGAIRQIIREVAPKATESIKWAQPVWEENGPMIWLKAYKNYVNVGFWRGVELSDPKGLLEGEGSLMRHVKINSLEDLNKPAIKRFVAQAAKLNRAKGNPTHKANR
jgi:hypothetical protein